MRPFKQKICEKFYGYVRVKKDCGTIHYIDTSGNHKEEPEFEQEHELLNFICILSNYYEVKITINKGFYEATVCNNGFAFLGNGLTLHSALFNSLVLMDKSHSLFN